MHVILIHGMGRTPLSMFWLRSRLKAAGHRGHLFGYTQTFESLDRVSARLIQRVQQVAGNEPYALIGHSLGSVIIRHALAGLKSHPPKTCFFIAPPMLACRAAKLFSRHLLYRLAAGQMGQLLASDDFMSNLPFPAGARIYAGVAGPKKGWLPHGVEANDGVLTLAEATGQVQGGITEVRALHTFIMNSKAVIDDIRQALDECD